MPLLVSALLGGLINIAATLAGRVLLSLGFGIATFTGFSLTIGWLKTSAVAAFVGLPGPVIGMLSAMKVGNAISIITSALLVRLLLNGLSDGGAISKLVIKR